MKAPRLVTRAPLSSLLTGALALGAVFAALPRLVVANEPVDPRVFQWANRARTA